MTNEIKIEPLSLEDLKNLSVTETLATVSPTRFNGTSATDLPWAGSGGFTTSATPNVKISSSPSAGGTAGGYVWTTHTTAVPNTYATINQNQSGKITLQGENADVDINGKSLKTWMEKVEERLNILTPNPELEKDWDNLRKLGERYRKLEKKCKEKAEVWKKLKSMPPPNTD